ncbi:hypothetical protein [Dongia sp.]|uniref:hypothetical protein n=1 Tax=Dongia sp. TaxID=1977262 RepID=UPI0035AE0B9A
MIVFACALSSFSAFMHGAQGQELDGDVPPEVVQALEEAKQGKPAPLPSTSGDPLAILEQHEERAKTRGSLTKLARQPVTYLDLGLYRMEMLITGMFPALRERFPNIEPLHVDGIASLDPELILITLYVSERKPSADGAQKKCTTADRNLIAAVRDFSPIHPEFDFDFAALFTDRARGSNPIMGDSYWAVRRSLALEISTISTSDGRELRSCLEPLLKQ